MASFGWDFPYTSQRMPVLAANVVATSQPLAAQAGLQMLYRGGNAADAAVVLGAGKQVIGQQRKILQSVSQGWDVELYHRQAVVEVLAETTCCDLVS